MEALTKLTDAGDSLATARLRCSAIGAEIVPLDEDLAVAAAALRDATRRRGLSLGDRTCLALALSQGAPAMTADRAWEGLDVGVEIILIR